MPIPIRYRQSSLSSIDIHPSAQRGVLHIHWRMRKTSLCVTSVGMGISKYFIGGSHLYARETLSNGQDMNVSVQSVTFTCLGGRREMHFCWRRKLSRALSLSLCRPDLISPLASSSKNARGKVRWDDGMQMQPNVP